MSSPIRILLVDDEQLVLSSLRRLLVREGLSVKTCSSGQEALALLETETVDLVLSDHRMPGMSGLEFLDHVASRWPSIRRCMLTAQADKELLDNASASGLLHDVFAKPWSNEVIINQIRALLMASRDAS